VSAAGPDGAAGGRAAEGSARAAAPWSGCRWASAPPAKSPSRFPDW